MRRIVLVVHTFPKLSETFIVSKFLGLLEHGWDAHIVCSQSDPREWAASPELQRRPELRRRLHVAWPHRPRWFAALLIPIAVVRCFIRNPSGTWRYLMNEGQSISVNTFRQIYLDAEMICLRPDLIHFEFGTIAVKRMQVQELLDCKVVVSFRGYDLKYVGLEEPGFYQEVWDKANAVHFLCESLWKLAQQRGCPPNKRHAVITPAIDTEFFDPLERRHTEVIGKSERPLRILSVGRLEWVKGYEYAFQAVELLAEQKVRCEYRIVGDGEYLEALTFARHKLGLEERIDMLGAQSSSEVKKHMLWADVFVHAAVSEGFCNAVVEAQAMALPVVCTDAGGLPENVADAETGFVVPRRAPRPLADKLFLLARNPDLRQQMGQAGRRRVSTHFRLEKQSADFDRLFRETLPEDTWREKTGGASILPRGYDLLAKPDVPKKSGRAS